VSLSPCVSVRVSGGRSSAVSKSALGSFEAEPVHDEPPKHARLGVGPAGKVNCSAPDRVRIKNAPANASRPQ
jgi:hypothetical protein